MIKKKNKNKFLLASSDFTSRRFNKQLENYFLKVLIETQSNQDVRVFSFSTCLCMYMCICTSSVEIKLVRKVLKVDK